MVIVADANRGDLISADTLFKVDDAGNKAEWNITGTPDHITYPALHDFNLSPFLYHTLLLSFRTRGLHVYFALLALHVM